MIKRCFKLIIEVMLFFILSIPKSQLFGQNGAAGSEDLFHDGVDARGFGLGNTSVAFPDDPSAFKANPAGMKVVQQKSVEISYTTLFEETQYHFIGYIHPTLSTGTFGFGVTRIGTGGISHYENIRGVPVRMGEIGYWWAKFSMAYAVTFLKALSLGINFEVNRQELGWYTTNGFGLDVGMLYAFRSKRGILKNVYLGVNCINALKPRLKLGPRTETLPYLLKWGVAKVFYFRNNNDRWLLLADLENPQEKQMLTHFGTEYSWNGLFFLRLGANDNDMTFGGGIRIKNFQLDYATGQIGDSDAFPRSHRFSLIFHIGKTIPEQRRILEQKRQEEIRRKIQDQMEEAHQKRINDGLHAGKEYFDKGDYFNARLEFSRVLAEDSGNSEAKTLLSQTTEKEHILQKNREEELLRQDREKEQQIRDNAFINQRISEGLDAMEKGDFHTAIEKWQQGLEKDTNHPLIKDYLQKAKIELNNEVNKLIATAGQLMRQENLPEAYKVLERAKNQSEGNIDLHNKVLAEVKHLDNVVNFQTNYQAGVQNYNKREYDAAAQFFKKALEYEPNNDRIREFYRNALARSSGSRKELEGDVKKKYYEGLRYYKDGRYEDALKVWEEALELEPNNLRILDAVQGVKNKLETFKKQP